jgi:ribosomal protein S18 acetylase RimI-like enzyme
MSSIEIIRLRPEHGDMLLRFFEEINVPQYTANFSPHPFDREQAKLSCNYRGRDLYYSVILNREKIIGYCMLRGWDEGYEIPSLGLCVLKEYQGFGLGRAMMNFLETVSRLRGCTKTMLRVRKDNSTARKLYLSQGYVFNDRNEDFLIGFKDLPSGATP